MKKQLLSNEELNTVLGGTYTPPTVCYTRPAQTYCGPVTYTINGRTYTEQMCYTVPAETICS